MSYDIGLSVKVQGCDKYVQFAEPQYSSPTYNLGRLFRACMDWDYSQSEKDNNGEYHTCYYPCDFVIERVERGLRELRTDRLKYEHLQPENGFGTIDSAILCLESVRECIYEQAEDIPLNCMYMSW